MSLKGYIDDKCQEAALAAANFTSSVIQSQSIQQTSMTGLMEIQSIDNSTNPPTLQVLDQNQNYQTISYVGSDYIYPGQSIFCSNGFAQ